MTAPLDLVARMQLLAAIRDHANDISPSATLVFMMLVTRMNENGEAWPSNPRLAAECNTSTNTARKATRELETKGYITITSRRHEETGRDTSNVYTLARWPTEVTKRDSSRNVISGGEGADSGGSPESNDAAEFSSIEGPANEAPCLALATSVLPYGGRVQILEGEGAAVAPSTLQILEGETPEFGSEPIHRTDPSRSDPLNPETRVRATGGSRDEVSRSVTPASRDVTNYEARRREQIATAIRSGELPADDAHRLAARYGIELSDESEGESLGRVGT